MPSARYYREQARVLLTWANESQDEATSQRLTSRARKMLDLAEQTQDRSATLNASLDHFNNWQMVHYITAKA